ncbi:MAG: OmpA family protein [Paludibacteraceae bacterium]|nr:OmpA family protein [Paludibacteraceae bacterium]
MSTKVFIAATTIAALTTFNVWAIDRQFQQGYDLKAAAISKNVNENNISFYRNNQLLIFKPNEKKNKSKLEPFTVNIKPDGDLSKPKASKELSKMGLAAGTVAYDSINNILYFAKYNSIEHDYALYQAQGTRGKWGEVEKMRIDGVGTERQKKSFILTAGWNYKAKGLTGFRNPSIAKDGKRIYFTAKLGRNNGNVGSTDIYYIDKKNDGTWSYPQNAGKNINTHGREDYAFSVGDSVMYYTSTGRGNVDLYKSYWRDGAWTKGENILAPINSHARDQNLIACNDRLYFVSNRDPRGADDIWLFRKQPDTALIPNPVPIPPEPEPEPIYELKKNWNFVLFYFDFDKDVLTPEFLEQFEELVSEMKQFPGETFEIDGHTDNRGSDKYNQKLSERRAGFVRKLLIQEGFPANKLVSKGFGESNPVVPNAKSEDEHQLNRRVEVRIIPADSSIQKALNDSVKATREEAEEQMPADYKLAPDAKVVPDNMQRRHSYSDSDSFSQQRARRRSQIQQDNSVNKSTSSKEESSINQEQKATEPTPAAKPVASKKDRSREAEQNLIK